MATIRRVTRRFRHDVAYAVVRALTWCARRMNRSAGRAVFAGIGWCVGLLSVGGRRIARENITAVFGGEWSPRRIRTLSRRIYGELGQNAFEAFYLAHRPPDELERIVRPDSLDEFRAAYDEGRGVVALTAHVGCFEVLLHYFAVRGFKCFAIGRRQFDPRIDRIVRGLRSGPNIEYVDRDDNPRKMIRLLHEGRVMGALIDQDTSVDGVFAHFLGKLAHTPSGPLRLAMRYHIPVFVVTTARMADGTHHVYISSRLSLENTGRRDRDLVMNTEQANARIGDAIRHNPEQWVWMHRRWRKQPGDSGMEGIANIENHI